jgi:hypothetical protein
MRRDAEQPQVTLQPGVGHAEFQQHGGIPLKDEFMSQARLVNTLIGPYGLHAILGLVLALFALFIYTFNFTSFF